MMNKTGIAYLTHTWNPLTMRCAPCSPGCLNCWHLKVADRLANNPMIDDHERKAYTGLIGPHLVNDRLGQPERVKKPSIIGTQFMGDLFLDTVMDVQRIKIFQAMATAEQHLFLPLTKRTEEALRFYEMRHSHFNTAGNVMMGFTAENQEWFDRRWEHARKIPGRLWVSAEPLLGPIDLQHIGGDRFGWGRDNPLDGLRFIRANAMETGCEWETESIQKITWLAVGPETGPNRRPCDPEWIRSIVEQCTAASVPVFVKAYPIGSRISTDPAEWPEWARRQELPGKES